MDIQVVRQAVGDVSSDALVVGAASSSDGVQLAPAAATVDNALNGLIHECYHDGEFRGNLGELLTIHTMGKIASKRVLVVGLGKLSVINTQALRRAAATAVRHLQNSGTSTVALALQWPDTGIDDLRAVQAQVEGALLGAYTFKTYRQNKNKQQGITQALLLAEQLDATECEQAVHKGQIMAEATNFARTLVNEPPNVLTPTELAKRAASMATQVGLECEVLNKEQIIALGMGGLLAVSQGSAQPPHFIILRHRGALDSTDKGMALVGKGITFDTGGISIKPAYNMDEMKSDMGGAAAVLGAMQAIAQLKPRINVTALVPTCENMPSGTSYRPGDILRLMNGKTIEIINTDAEGRLILADALAYAVKEGLSPIVDLATLTGGIVVALGYVMSGLFCNNEALQSKILAAGRDAGEKYWPMPLDEEYGERIKSDVADILQTAGRPGSAISAAKVLEHFVGNAQWAHFDIAGTAYLDHKKPYQEKGATGVGVRMLAELALQLAQ